MPDRHASVRLQRTARTAVQAMQPVQKGFGFESALSFLKAGFRASRRGWNGKGMFIVVTDPDTPGHLPYLMFFTADRQWVPWSPSNTDLLAHDWLVTDDQGIEVSEQADVPVPANRQFEQPVPYRQGIADPSVPVAGSGAGILGNQ